MGALVHGPRACGCRGMWRRAPPFSSPCAACCVARGRALAARPPVVGRVTAAHGRLSGRSAGATCAPTRANTAPMDRFAGAHTRCRCDGSYSTICRRVSAAACNVHVWSVCLPAVATLPDRHGTVLTTEETQTNSSDQKAGRSSRCSSRGPPAPKTGSPTGGRNLPTCEGGR